MNDATPTFDGEGYPTEETLRIIRDWPCLGLPDMEAVMDFVGQAWHWPEYWAKQTRWRDRRGGSRRTRYVFSTSGWSGNESLVEAIEANALLQVIGAWSWRRGGHYEYRFPDVVPEKENAR